MKITIDTNILNKHQLSLGQFLILLTSYYNLDCIRIRDELIATGLTEKNLFQEFPPILSDNTKNLITQILLESSIEVQQCGIDLTKVANSLIECYPKGLKPGTTYSWAGDAETIFRRLAFLVTRCDFRFTEEEAINAAKEYISSFNPNDCKKMHTLRNFIYRAVPIGPDGEKEIESMFMTIIENNRE